MAMQFGGLLDELSQRPSYVTQPQWGGPAPVTGAPAAPPVPAAPAQVNQEPGRFNDFVDLLAGNFMGGRGIVSSLIGAGLGSLADVLGRGRDEEAAENESLADIYSKSLARHVTPEMAGTLRDNPQELAAMRADTARRRELMTAAGQAQVEERERQEALHRQAQAIVNEGLAPDINTALGQIDLPEWARAQAAENDEEARLIAAGAEALGISEDEARALGPLLIPSVERAWGREDAAADHEQALSLAAAKAAAEGGGKSKLTAAQSDLKSYMNMAIPAFEMLSQIGPDGQPLFTHLQSSYQDVASRIPFFSRFLTSDQFKGAKAGAEWFAEAKLRDLTGATATEQEVLRLLRSAIPKPGDPAYLTNWKMAQIREAIRIWNESLPADHQAEVPPPAPQVGGPTPAGGAEGGGWLGGIGDAVGGFVEGLRGVEGAPSPPTAPPLTGGTILMQTPDGQRAMIHPDEVEWAVGRGWHRVAE